MTKTILFKPLFSLQQGSVYFHGYANGNAHRKQRNAYGSKMHTLFYFYAYICLISGKLVLTKIETKLWRILGVIEATAPFYNEGSAWYHLLQNITLLNVTLTPCFNCFDQNVGEPYNSRRYLANQKVFINRSPQISALLRRSYCLL